VVTLTLLEKFNSLNFKTILYTHELSFAVESFYKNSQVIDKISKIDYILAGSKAVHDLFLDEYKYKKDHISICYSFPANLSEVQKIDNIKEEYGISEDTFIIGTLSTQELRKGSDLIPQIARKIVQKAPKLKFVILNVGGTNNNPFVRMSKYDAKKLKVEDKIIFIENTLTPNKFLESYDCLLIPSREDPFPLVMLEGAKLGKPIVGFQNSGGIDEFLVDTDLAAKYLDIDDMAEIIIKLCTNANFNKDSIFKIKSNSVKFSKENSLDELYRVLNIL
jgi:glycosyltransferase involved in cell wall biosynthesis